MSDPATRRTPDQAAEDLLRRCGVTKPPVDVKRIAEEIGAIVHLVDAPDSVSGALIRKDGRTIIGVNKNHHSNRRRFTIAHELGHLLLHLEQLQQSLFVDESTVYLRNEVSSKAVSAKEIQANRFAAAVLMPKQFLLRRLADRRLDINDPKVEALAREYQVSVQALTLRLSSLGLVDGIARR